MNAPWRDALDTQIELANWLASENGRRFGGGYFASAYSTDGPVFNPWTSSEDAYRAGVEWAQKFLAVKVFNAEPVAVDPDMMAVVEAAIDGFQPEPLVENDLIVPDGLLLLPRGLPLIDRNGRLMTWRGALWTTGATKEEGPGIQIALLHDPKEADDFDYQLLNDPTGIPADGLATYRRIIARAPLLPTHVSSWAFGKMHPATYDEVTNEGREAGMLVHRQVQAVWRLLQQHLAVVTRERPPRAYAKRAARARLPHERVVVVRLRRPPQDRETHEPANVNWTHRWIVGGHWRNQWYAATQMHRQIWISPYVKGPEELELIVPKGRIFELVR